MMKYAFSLLLILGTSLLSGQDFFDGFEGQNLSDWEVLRGDAITVTNPIIEGNQSLQLGATDINAPETIIIHRTFSDNYGTYEFYARGDGSDSDADFYFQFIDLSNYYLLSIKPANTDNPGFSLTKVVQGQVTELANLPPVNDRSEWVRITIDRLCEGHIVVRVNNTYFIDILDNDLRAPGSIGFRGYGQFSYFDSLTFVGALPFFESPSPMSIQACTGSGFAFGNVIYNMDGVYSDTITTINGCDSIVTIDLEFVEHVMVDTTFNICSGDSIQVGSNFYSEEDSYSEMLTTTAGCDSTVNFDIAFTQLLTTTRDSSICRGDTIFIENLGISTIGQYDFSFLTLGGCDSLVIWNVTFVENTLELGADGFICPGELLLLDAGTFEDYLWNDLSTNSDLNVDMPGTYSVTVIDDLGCSFADSISISEQCALVVLGANIFSPNGDGVNDTWRPTFSQPPTEYSLEIFDRWGSLLFSTNDLSQSWNGELNGNLLASGVYTWMVTADGESFMSDITLIR